VFFPLAPGERGESPFSFPGQGTLLREESRRSHCLSPADHPKEKKKEREKVHLFLFLLTLKRGSLSFAIL